MTGVSREMYGLSGFGILVLAMVLPPTLFLTTPTPQRTACVVIARIIGLERCQRGKERHSAYFGIFRRVGFF